MKRNPSIAAILILIYRNSKIPSDKNKMSCDQNDETIWSHDLTKIQFELSNVSLRLKFLVAMLTV